MSDKVDVYVVNTNLCGGTVIVDNIQDVINTIEYFLADENGHERKLTEDERNKITTDLTDMKLGDKCFFEDFAVEYMEMNKEKFENLPEFDGC